MSIATRGVYRTWQAWQALRAGPLSFDEWQEVKGVLVKEQLTLFAAQSMAGQQHGYRVMRTLKDAGHDEPELLVAALLHDLGKYQTRFTWLDKVKVVLTQRLAPGQATKWSKGPQRGWTRAYVVKEAHPEWGAEALAAAGGSDLSVALVRRHQDPVGISPSEDNKENRLLALLQWADNQN